MSLVAISAEAAAQGGIGVEARSLSFEIAQSLADVETLWRAFESEAIASPYQRFDWVRAYVDAFSGTADALRVVVLRDETGRPLMLLPLVLSRRHGFRIAASVGGKHANFNMPLMRRGFAQSLTAERAQAILREIGRQLGADALAIPHMPVTWRGEPNPFAAGGRPSPSNGYRLRLDPDADATLTRASSGSTRKKRRNKERGLAKLGEVAVLEGRTEADVDLILGEFLRQKRRRFLELGITDPFVEPEAQAFLRRACLDGLVDGRHAIEVYALTLDGTVVAVLGGAGDRERLSGMFISFDAADEVARLSPGEILVAQVIALQCARDRSVFDLGVGEARYKLVFCDELDELVDLVLPTSLLGRIYAAVVGVGIDAKRRVKASPHAMRLVALVRRARSATAPAE
ncbi:MAG TPA: GNAT family N-acetyltransferase [Enterovirga sp.]|jgi:CelD/BcsL family acetyltransferase involved in cellulose biosynthesis|nr:GNAT family N-acetyltransferase [Enterovirga sp.]